MHWNNSTLRTSQRFNKAPNFGIPHEIVNDCAELKSPVCAPTFVSHNRRQAIEFAIVDNRTTSFIRSIHFSVFFHGRLLTTLGSDVATFCHEENSSFTFVIFSIHRRLISWCTAKVSPSNPDRNAGEVNKYSKYVTKVNKVENVCVLPTACKERSFG